ncbi:MAG: spermidine/putrescine ABC transporter substrate-binding protein [Nocardioidaceae bacterium]|nr:spermidine/putrescine ABC transporter substrate-binding protein [Nocardioidaceae bacterium]
MSKPLSSQVSRRGFMRGASLSALAVGGSGLLASCGTEGAKVEEGSCESTDKSESEQEVSFSNWPLYLDPIKAKDTSTLEKFEQVTGIAVSYDTDVNDNLSFKAKVAPQLQACKSTSRDVFVLTDWMAAQMIELGWLQELDHANMPNVDANLLDSLKSPSWDPERKYSVPWQSGMTGIAYNAELTDPVTSFQQLLTRPELKGKITLLTEMRDTMLFMLLMQGADPEDFTDDEFSNAIAELQKYVDNGQVRRFTGNDYTDDLKQGNVAACEAWSGDIAALGNPKFKWLAPEEGISLWSDNMLVPNLAEHKTNVEKLINFYYEPVNAAKLAAWNYYFCPVKGAEDEIAQFDKSAVGNPLIFPAEDMLSRGYTFMGLDATQDKNYQAQFNQVQGG